MLLLLPSGRRRDKLRWRLVDNPLAYYKLNATTTTATTTTKKTTTTPRRSFSSWIRLQRRQQQQQQLINSRVYARDTKKKFIILELKNGIQLCNPLQLFFFASKNNKRLTTAVALLAMSGGWLLVSSWLDTKLWTGVAPAQIPRQHFFFHSIRPLPLHWST